MFICSFCVTSKSKFFGTEIILRDVVSAKSSSETRISSVLAGPRGKTSSEQSFLLKYLMFVSTRYVP